MSQVVGQFTMHVDRMDGYQFRTRFDKEHYSELLMDEPAPLGVDSAPNPARILGAALGNCLAASLLFCLARAKINVEQLSADVEVKLVRNEKKRLRVGSVDVTLHPSVASGADLSHCLEIFQDFCVVTESVRQGLEVNVRVQSEPQTRAVSAASNG